MRHGLVYCHALAVILIIFAIFLVPVARILHQPVVECPMDCSPVQHHCVVGVRVYAMAKRDARRLNTASEKT